MNPTPINLGTAVDLDPSSRSYGWQFYRHPDGRWVTERKILEDSEIWGRTMSGKGYGRLYAAWCRACDTQTWHWPDCMACAARAARSIEEAQ